MLSRPRKVTLAAFGLAVVLVAAVLVAVNRDRASSTPAAPTPITGPRIVFRHTGLDAHYGEVATVSLGDPGGSRTFTALACDRVYATRSTGSCLQTVRGTTTTFRLLETDPRFRPLTTVALRGIPSRTRLSADGKLVATTVFVTGHAYEQVGFSTVTDVRDVGGADLGNLETFTLILDGRRVDPEDANVWGVTFARDDRTFYATVATDGRTHLVRGDLRTRTLTSVRTNAECPSLSPDGRHVAYKVLTSTGAVKHWTPAVLDLATGQQTMLAGESRTVDDQLEWLDDDTVLYGLPRVAQPGVDDVWSLDTTATARPHLLIRQAWSPAVVR